MRLSAGFLGSFVTTKRVKIGSTFGPVKPINGYGANHKVVAVAKARSLQYNITENNSLEDGRARVSL
jgi:hypothetical protein